MSTQKTELSRTQIEAFLPQREPFLMVSGASVTGQLDHADELYRKDPIRVWWNLPADSWVVRGHFPEDPLVPGVLILEAMAQSCGLLARCFDESSRDRPVLLVSVNNARFLRPVRVPCRIDMWPNFMKVRGPIWKFIVRAEVSGETVATAEIMARLLDAGTCRSEVEPTVAIRENH